MTVLISNAVTSDRHDLHKNKFFGDRQQFLRVVVLRPMCFRTAGIVVQKQPLTLHFTRLRELEQEGSAGGRATHRERTDVLLQMYRRNHFKKLITQALFSQK